MTILLTQSEIRELLARSEGQFLEFKSAWDRSNGTIKQIERRAMRDLIAENIAAFANADGGTLIIGVDDDGTPTGHGYPEEAVRDFVMVPERRLRPQVKTRSQLETIDGHNIIIIQVDPTENAIMVEANGFPYRANDQVIREPQEIINERKLAYRRVGFELRVNPDASFSDLDLEVVRETIGKTIHKQRNPEDILIHYGLIIPAAGGYKITNAALILFGMGPVSRWHPNAGIRLFKVSGTERTHGDKRNVAQLSRLEGPLVRLIPETHRLIATHIRRSEKLHNLFFIEKPEYPEFAWQEALVNAVAHRDYCDIGRGIEVWLYEDRLEVSSPGLLIPPVTLEKLRARTNIHASRNPRIVRVLADMGIMREEGEGISRMYEEMEESFLNPPEFLEDASGFCVTLRNQPVFEGPSPEWQATVRKLPINERQRRVLLSHPLGFSNEIYRKLNRSINRDDAYREIQELILMGIVEPSKSTGRGAKYRISAGLLNTKVWLEGRIPGLRAHFKTNKTLTNAGYQALFNVTRNKAFRELARLSEHGYLIQVGERRGAHYLPGPSLGGQMS